MRSRRDSARKAGLREVPGERWALKGRFLCRLRVTVRRKPETLLGVGERLVLGVGSASPLPSCPLDKPGQKAWGQDGVSAPGTPSSAPWDAGADHEPEGAPKARKSFPPEGGEEAAACALTAWPILVKRGKQRGGFPSRLSINGPSKRPLDFRVPELCPVRRGWEVLAP